MRRFSFRSQGFHLADGPFQGHIIRFTQLFSQVFETALLTHQVLADHRRLPQAGRLGMVGRFTEDDLAEFDGFIEEAVFQCGSRTLEETINRICTRVHRIRHDKIHSRSCHFFIFIRHIPIPQVVRLIMPTQTIQAFPGAHECIN